MALYIEMKKLRKREGVHRIRKLRDERGAFKALLPELKWDPREFKKYTRMSLQTFGKQLELVRPR
ncbi:hypothetical protein AAVH_12912 [Aphelenchoides avenae]|nr:hypothetical protein AAVH_12912 [Aphelenchus avenae]